MDLLGGLMLYGILSTCGLVLFPTIAYRRGWLRGYEVCYNESKSALIEFKDSVGQKATHYLKELDKKQKNKLTFKK